LLWHEEAASLFPPSSLILGQKGRRQVSPLPFFATREETTTFFFFFSPFPFSTVLRQIRQPQMLIVLSLPRHVRRGTSFFSCRFFFLFPLVKWRSLLFCLGFRRPAEEDDGTICLFFFFRSPPPRRSKVKSVNSFSFVLRRGPFPPPFVFPPVLPPTLKRRERDQFFPLPSPLFCEHGDGAGLLCFFFFFLQSLLFDLFENKSTFSPLFFFPHFDPVRIGGSVGIIPPYKVLEVEIGNSPPPFFFSSQSLLMTSPTSLSS